MARLSPSSNISHHTADPRRQHDDDNNNNVDDNDDVHHDDDGPGLRISSPDYVDVDIPHAAAAAPGQQSPTSTSSEGYPSWLPKRPPPPAPGSTLHSLSTAMMFDGGGGAGAAGDFPAAASPSSGGDDRHHQTQTPVPFSGGRKPTPRSVRIVSMQDSNAAASATGGAGGAGARREPTERTTATPRVSSTVAGASHYRLPSLPFLPSSLFRSRVWSRAKASALEGLSPTLLSSSQTPDARLRAASAAPPKFRSPGLHLELLRDPSWKTRLHFYLFPLLVLAHLPLQSYLDFNAVYIMIE